MTIRTTIKKKEFVVTIQNGIGPQGRTPVLTAGKVTQLEPGEYPTVTITGPAEAPVISFGIPKSYAILG